VRIAGGIHVDAGSLLVRKATDHVTEEGSATISLRGAGIGADAALYVTVAEPLAIGISYKSRTRLALAGEADFDVPDPFAAGLADQEVSAPWTLPDRLAFPVLDSHAQPEVRATLHPAAAERYGIAEGDTIELSNERGVIRARAMLSRDVRPGDVFVPFHFSGDGTANLLTSDAVDPVSAMPEFKTGAVRVRRFEEAIVA